MSTTDRDPEQQKRVDRAAATMLQYMAGSGNDRFERMAEDIFDTRLGGTQRKVLRTVANNRRTLIVSGNGVGKSYAVALLILAFLYSTPDSIALLTSGSYTLLSDTTWKPMKSMFRHAQENSGLPGRAVGGEGGSPPRLHTEMGDEWFFKAISPTKPGSLEGRHAEDILVVIEEADKDEITEAHFDSAGSSLTNMNDRMVAVANPPEDESNVVYEKMQSDRWEVVQFSSFESHNVAIDSGTETRERIPGLVDLPIIAEDYEAWNNEPWPEVPADWPGADEMLDSVEAGRLSREKLVDMLKPGLAHAREFRGGMDTRWYRRRLGVMPPDDSTEPRPWTVADVEQAKRRWSDTVEGYERNAIGVDVARGGGDRTAVCEIKGNAMTISATAMGNDHVENEELVAGRIDDAPLSGAVGVDAVGEGSGIPDHLRRDYPEFRFQRFHGGASAGDDENYDNARAEALQMLGNFLRDGGAVKPGSALAEELRAHARHCTFEEKMLRAATVYAATPKDDIKEELDHSPDLVDAAAIAAWVHGGFGIEAPHVGTWGSEFDSSGV